MYVCIQTQTVLTIFFNISQCQCNFSMNHIKIHSEATNFFKVQLKLLSFAFGFH